MFASFICPSVKNKFDDGATASPVRAKKQVGEASLEKDYTLDGTERRKVASGLCAIVHRGLPDKKINSCF
jgi:hypothetical protein